MSNLESPPALEFGTNLIAVSTERFDVELHAPIAVQEQWWWLHGAQRLQPADATVRRSAMLA